MRSPLKVMLPSCDATSLSSARPVVDLPQPDSPPAPAFRPARDQN